jgi:hypothetical protein
MVSQILQTMSFDPSMVFYLPPDQRKGLAIRPIEDDAPWQQLPVGWELRRVLHWGQKTDTPWGHLMLSTNLIRTWRL